MKRYEELTVYKEQSDGTLVRTLPEYPSRCLSIDLREQTEAEAKDKPERDIQWKLIWKN